MDTYGAGLATIDSWIAALRSMPEMVNAAAPEVATAVESALKASTSAGTSLDGQPWALTKKGARALKNAANAFTVRVSGNTILIQLTGHHVFHHFGTGWLPQRPIIPVGGLPDRLGNAIRKGLVDMGVEWMTRGGKHTGKFGWSGK